jgi:hypothetical protein
VKENKQLEWFIEILKDLLLKDPDFTGRIEINFFKGGIANINVLKSYKPNK